MSDSTGPALSVRSVRLCCCFGGDEIPGPRAHGQLSPTRRSYFDSNRAVSTAFRVWRTTAESVLMANVCGDLLTNTHDFRAGLGKIHLSPRVRSELLENFRVLVSGVFVKQS